MATNSTVPFEEGEEDYMTSSLSENQDRILALLPIIPAFWSAWGSANILYMFCTSNKSSSYRRIMFGLSCCDFINSVLFPFHAFLVPRQTSHSVWAIGTQGTCTFLGFLMQFGFSSVWYSTFLSVYFLMLVRFQVKDTIFKWRYEPWMHLLCVGYPLVTATIGVIIGLYDELDLGDGCWITNYPKGCSDQDPDIQDCQSSTFGWIFSGLPTVFSFLLIVINNIVVYRHVQKAMQKAQLDSVRSAGNSRLDPHIKRIKAVQTQSFFYVGAFLFTYLPAFTLRVLESLWYQPGDEARLFPLLALQMITLPSQGLLNCLIYVRPTYLKARREFPDESMYWAFQRALHGERVQPTDEHRPSSVFDAPASQVALTRGTKEKQSQLDMSALTTADNDTSTTHLDALDGSSRFDSSNHDQRGQPSCEVDTADSNTRANSRRTSENPPIMPRRLETFVEDDFDEMLLAPDDNKKTSSSRRFGKGWKTKKSSTQPNSSQIVSSMVGSELDCIDEAPGQPVRVASQAEATLPPTSRSNKNNFSVRENPPVMPRRVDTDIGDDFDEPPLGHGHHSPLKGFMLSLKKKKSSPPQPADSQVVSSLVGSEFDFVDEAPGQPVRVESLVESTLPPTSRSNKHDFSPAVPRRVQSGVMENPPTMPRRLDTDIEDELDEPSSETSKHEHNSRHPFTGLLLAWKKKKSSSQHGNRGETGASLGVNTELDCIDEAPGHRARVESQGDTPLPLTRSHPKTQQPPSSHRARVESQGEPPLPARTSKRGRQPPPNPWTTPQGQDTDSVARPIMPRRVDSDVEDISDDISL